MEAKKSRREMLANYYAANTDKPADKPSDSAPKLSGIQQQETEMAHDELIRKESLQGLLQKHQDLKAGIKSLGGNLKTLGYTNYTRFLDTTTTISKFKYAVAEIDSKVSTLQASVDKISDSLIGLTSILNPKRAQIQHLGSIHYLVKKLNLIMVFPAHLTELRSSNKYAEAAIFYLNICNLLGNYANIPMLKHIEDECKSVMDPIRSVTQERITSKEINMYTLCESFAILLVLSKSVDMERTREFIYRGSVVLEEITKKVEEIDGTTQSQIDQLESVLAKFNKTYLSSISLFSDCFKAFFLVKSIEEEFANDLERLQQYCFIEFGESDVQAAQGALDIFVTSKIDTYFTLLESKLLKFAETFVSSGLLIHVLTILKNDLSETPNLQLESRITHLIVTVTDKIIHVVLDKVIAKFFEKIRELMAENSKTINKIRMMTNWIKEALIANALSDIEGLFKYTDSIGISNLLLRIKEALTNFWPNLAAEILRKSQGGSVNDLLFLGRLADDWSKGVIESINSMYYERLFISSNGIVIPGISDSEIQALSKDISTKFNLIGQRLMSKYAQRKVLQLTLQTRQYIQKDLANAQGTNLSSCMKEVVELIKKDINELDSIIKIEESKKKTVISPRKESVSHSRQTTPSFKGVHLEDSHQFDSVLNTLDKLFDEKMVYLPQKVQMSTLHVIETIIKTMFKGMFEDIRLLNELQPAQIHQIQIDCAYLKEHLSEDISEKLLNKLIQEIMSSSYIKCKSKSFKPKDSNTIAQILSKA